MGCSRENKLKWDSSERVQEEDKRLVRILLHFVARSWYVSDDQRWIQFKYQTQHMKSGSLFGVCV